MGTVVETKSTCERCKKVVVRAGLYEGIMPKGWVRIKAEEKPDSPHYIAELCPPCRLALREFMDAPGRRPKAPAESENEEFLYATGIKPKAPAESEKEG